MNDPQPKSKLFNKWNLNNVGTDPLKGSFHHKKLTN